ncbi:MAG: hypothetical protein FWC54_04095 [Actinomycetia bacterium]|nr:hypothetical protein [Actinomycetes bacterium]
MPATKSRLDPIDKEKVRKEMREARVRREIQELEYRRKVKWGAGKLTQVDLASSLGIAQPTLSGVLKTAEKIPEPREGFSGATPLEICKRYSIHELSREQLIDELVRWDYTKPSMPNDWDSLVVDPPGAFSEVELAADIGLIDDSIYDEVFYRRHPKKK